MRPLFLVVSLLLAGVLVVLALAPAPTSSAPAAVVDAGAPGGSLRHPVEMHLRVTHDDRNHVTCWANVDDISGTYSAPFCLRDTYADQPADDPITGPKPAARKGDL